MGEAFLNGRFVPEADARVSAFDAGLLHGVGLFETMIARRTADGPEVRALDAHLNRLVASAQQTGLSVTLRAGALAEAVLQTVERAAPERVRVRVTVTGGDLNLLTRTAPGPRPAVDPTVLITAQAATEYPADMFVRGVGVTIADTRANPLDPLAGHKTLNYWGRLRALQDAAGKRAGESIVLQGSNHLAGACVSNVLLVRGGALLTPIARGEEGPRDSESPREGATPGVFLPSPVLPGVTRAEVIDLASGLGLACTRRMLSIGDLLGADEVFLTNSSWGVLPVVKVEREAIGDGVVGPISMRLREKWLEDW